MNGYQNTRLDCSSDNTLRLIAFGLTNDPVVQIDRILEKPRWSDYRPSFDLATDNNVRVIMVGEKVRVQFLAWSSGHYGTFLTGCIVLPISLILAAFLAVAPWGWKLFVFAFCSVVLLAFSMMVKTEFDVSRSIVSHEYCFCGRRLWKRSRVYGNQAKVKIERAKFEDTHTLRLRIVDGTTKFDVFDFHQTASREKAEILAATLEEMLRPSLSSSR